MATGGRGRPSSPQTVAEVKGIDAYALIEYLGRQGEVRRLKQECSTVVDWLDDHYLDLDDRLIALGASDEARRLVWASRDELVRFHQAHYRYSIANTETICDEMQRRVREAQEYGSWWQQRPEQLAFEGVTS